MASFEEPWEDPAGSLSDLPDDMFEELDKIRHDKVPLIKPWKDPAGAWSDLPDTMFEELDKIRHANPPTPPIELPY